MQVGVLALQGDFALHASLLEGIGVEAPYIKTSEELDQIDALVIPGGESTTVGKLMQAFNITDAVKGFIEKDKPVLGTCAGMVLLAEQGGVEVEKTSQPLIGVVDAMVERNAFGPQRESFETTLDIPVLGEEEYPGVFIRAPAYREVGEDVEVLCSLDDNIVAARQDNVLVTAFHPELSGDPRLLEYFIEMA